ncbi:MAG: [protein-PII] uridylyltransferase [Planctomycetota bacterium]
MAAMKLPAAVMQSRERLLQGRPKLKAQHDSGSPGLQVCVLQADLVDSVVLDLASAAFESLGVTDTQEAAGSFQYALVAHGGYGRRDLAPFSDVDLMLLHSPASADRAASFARLLTQWIVDAGCQLGFSLRTPKQACKLSWEDAATFSSLVESRLLSGSIQLFGQMMRSLRQGAKRRTKRLIQAVEAARREERRKYGETVFLLEPNVKRSRGSLRDIQLVRWIGFARYGECDLEKLAQLGHLDQEDYKVLRNGYKYLLRLRNQMHFDASKSQDQLDRALQMRLADWSGYQGEEGMLPVEQFMREYFEHTSEIRYSSAHFVNDAKWQSPVSKAIESSFALPIQRDFRVGFRHVWATRAGKERVKRDPAAVLELMAISSRFGRSIEHETWREIRAAMRQRNMTEIDGETIDRFMELMARSNNLAGRLRRLHELRVLEQIIPAMAHARCLLQFNQYHKYTVDAHSIRAVECVTELANDKSTLGSIYRSLKNKTILHLALLLHDLGKGFPEDHSEVGRRIAEETADRLRLNAQDKETLSFLVHQHLLLTHTAFRFDLNDRQAAVNFAAQVGSSERLSLLLLLSYADLASVGPGVVNQWKVDLLLQLYYQTDSHFRDDGSERVLHKEVEERRRLLRNAMPKDEGEQSWEEHVQALPVNHLLRTSTDQVANQLVQLRDLRKDNCLVWGQFLREQKAVEYIVVTQMAGEPIGTFYRITGALASKDNAIIAADVHTLPGDIGWDRFLVEDLEFEDEPPESRIDFVADAVAKAIHHEGKYEPVFPKKWGTQSKQTQVGLQNQPTQVRFDNATSENFTIITLFAYDRRGLLFSVAKVLFEMQLVLQAAKISTHLDQVVDVFYISDPEGNKVNESTRLYMIRQRLLQAASATT